MRIYLKKTKKTKAFIRFQVVPEPGFDPAKLADVQGEMDVVGTLYFRPEAVKGKEVISLVVEGVKVEAQLVDNNDSDEKPKPTKTKKSVKARKIRKPKVSDDSDGNEESETPKRKPGRPKKNRTEDEEKPRKKKSVKAKLPKNIKKNSSKEEETEEVEPKSKPTKKPSKFADLCRWCKFLNTDKCPSEGFDFDIDDPDELCGDYKERK